MKGGALANTNFAKSAGCSATTGVTAGLYSLVVQNTSGNYIWDQVGTNADFESPNQHRFDGTDGPGPPNQCVPGCYCARSQ